MSDYLTNNSKYEFFKDEYGNMWLVVDHGSHTHTFDIADIPIHDISNPKKRGAILGRLHEKSKPLKYDGTRQHDYKPREDFPDFLNLKHSSVSRLRSAWINFCEQTCRNIETYYRENPSDKYSGINHVNAKKSTVLRFIDSLAYKKFYYGIKYEINLNSERVYEERGRDDHIGAEFVGTVFIGGYESRPYEYSFVTRGLGLEFDS